MEWNRALLVAEATAFAGAVVFAVTWYYDPQGNWEPLVGLCSFVGVGAELYRRFAKRSISNRFESNAVRVRHRETLRKSLREEILKCRAEKLRQDVIVRHVDRVDVFRFGGLSYAVDCCDKAGPDRLTIIHVDGDRFDFWLTAAQGHTITSTSARFRELDEVVYAHVHSNRRANVSPVYVGRKPT